MKFMDILILLAKNKKLIICVTICASIAGFMLAWIYPKTYKTELRVRIDDSNNNKISIISDMNKNLSNLFGNSFQNESTDLFLEILEGRDNLTKIIKKFRLDSVYKKESIDLTLKMFLKDLDIGISDNGIVYCGYQSEDRGLAVGIVKALITNANKRYIDLEKERQILDRNFLQKKQQQLVDSLESVNKELIDFYKDNNVINIERQIELSLGALSTYESKMKTFEIDQKYIRKSIGPGASISEKYKDLIAILQGEFNKLRSKYENGYKPNRESVFLNTDWGLEKLLFEKIKMSQIQILKDFIGIISKELAFTEAQVSRNTPVVQIVQDAYYPDWKTKPKRAKWMIVACFISFTLSVFFVILRALINDEIQGCENGQKLRDLISAIKS